jgi:hypothetical protein
MTTFGWRNKAIWASSRWLAVSHSDTVASHVPSLSKHSSTGEEDQAEVEALPIMVHSGSGKLNKSVNKIRIRIYFRIPRI